MKKVLITGGNKGIGLAATKLFLEQGYKVIVVARDFEKFPYKDNEHVEIVEFDISRVSEIATLAEKIGAVDVEKFPKNRFMEPWKFISEDGRFNMTMVPTLDNHSDVDFKVGRMNCHQVYGVWNGDVTLDDGTKLIIKDLFTFCEYVENRW